MIIVGFYTIDDLNIKKVIERFSIDYPNIASEYNSEDEELIFNNVTDNMEDVDTFLCEEICHEFEVYCYIKDAHGNASKNYYYDEEDEWVYK
jgi:hypothetical protein